MIPRALMVPIGIVVRLRDSQGGTVRNQYSRQHKRMDCCVLRVLPQFPRTLVIPIGIVVRIRGSHSGTERIQQSRPQLKVLTGAGPSRGATVPAYARDANWHCCAYER